MKCHVNKEIIAERWKDQKETEQEPKEPICMIGSLKREPRDFQEYTGSLSVQEYIQDHLRNGEGTLSTLPPEGCALLVWQYENMK